MARDPDDDHVAGWPAVQLLVEPNRRAVYDVVRAARRPLTRDEVAAASGLSRRLATFHLDLLADAGLLDVDFARPEGRRGPGAGRPAKRYTSRDAEIGVSLPGRRYDLVARILAAGIRDEGVGGAEVAAHHAAVAEGRAVGERLAGGERQAVATRHEDGHGAAAGRTLEQAAEVLAELGYEPAVADDGSVRLANCPFHAVVDVAPELVCELNVSFLEGVLSGLASQGEPGLVAALCPSPPDCCVRIREAGVTSSG